MKNIKALNKLFPVFFVIVIFSIALMSVFLEKPKTYSGESTITGFAVSGGGSGRGGCPSINAINNFLVSNKVGASFSIDVSGTIVTYLFDSFVNENPVSGVPGLIAYCIYPNNPPGNPNSASAIATGADSSSFITSFGAIQGYFAFKRSHGNPSNIPLDGTTGTTIGRATWNSGAPTTQTILLHINDAAECFNLYGVVEDTCFVFPGQAPSPVLCNGNPACKQVVIDEAITTDPLIVPVSTLLHIHYTYVIVNQPNNTFNMIFNLPSQGTKDVNAGGAKDYFGCEQIPDTFGSPGSTGTYTNYQNTGFKMLMTVPKLTASCDQSRFFLTAPNRIILAPGQSINFTVDMITRKNKGGKQEYSSVGQHFLNSGFTVKWIQSDDNILHSFSTSPITIQSQ